MTNVRELQSLYEEGRCSEALARISAKWPNISETPIEIMEIKSWCYFRLGMHSKAKEIAEQAVNFGSLKAQELLAQIAGFTGDDEALMDIYKTLPSNISVCNALAIRSRSLESTIPISRVVQAAYNQINNPEIGAVNLMNNAARLLYEKGDAPDDLIRAIGMWHIVLVRYGDKNYHHKAAVYYWLTATAEKLDQLNLARECAAKSAEMWSMQVGLDPLNKEFGTKHLNAVRKLHKIDEKIKGLKLNNNAKV